MYNQFKKLATAIPKNAFNIYNVRDFIGETYQHECNSASVARTPSDVGAFIDNISNVGGNITNVNYHTANTQLNWDLDFNMSHIDMNNIIIEDLTNTGIYDFDELTIINNLNDWGEI